MERKGVHHLGLATLDIDRTIDFYTRILGWKVAWCDGTLVAFMCPEKVQGIPQEFKTDINSAQNLPPAFYHFAFNCNSVKELEQKREALLEQGVDVTPVVDHEWCRSIYFNDPNGLLLEFCTTVRGFNEDDKIMKHRAQPGPMVSNPEDARKVREKLMGRPQAAPA